MTSVLSPLLHALLLAWLAWVFLNFALMALFSILHKPTSAQFDGFRIKVPAWLRMALTERELAAFRQHEEGHRAHRHVWKNFARVCFFVGLTPEDRRRQEFEADDYCEDPAALASGIRKTSRHPFDLLRADRLDARTPYARVGRNTKEAMSI